ncbi:iron complex transport system substrate-binding protein [Haloactinospora alba]|uniref:Iron complex transport system substrate-binding protein n=1 Tax=Haloactinospora alba TaxID=405555 RepID=A0A543NGZ3_9ACTN|nr:iron-siderophore ABC transporter substrate-binding protein [Haloactinospora alba]TQN31117.1 iron complex transport system substrate-binding protein [Haloactinospora alba]
MPTASPARSSTRALLSVSAAAAVAFATACGTDGGSGDDSGGGEAAGFPLTVEHAMGETSVDSEPSTIVALDQSYVDAAVALETEVIGRTEYYTPDGEMPGYLGDPGEEYAGDAEELGSLESPDLARIAELEPDLIVSAKARHADIYDQLSEIAPTVFSETTGATWKENIELLGEALGKKDTAQQKIEDYETRAAEVGDAIAEENGGEAPTMTLARFAGEPTVRLYSSASFPGMVQADTGIPRPEDAPDTEDGISVDLSQEEILDLDADHIFVSQYDAGTGEVEDQAEEFRSNPLWDQLEGTKHKVDDVRWVSSVSLQGANAILDDLEETFDVQG